MARTDTLPHFLTDVADAIRTKTGESGTIQASTFDTAISNIPSGGSSDEYFYSTISAGTGSSGSSMNGYMSAIKKIPALTNSGTNCAYMFYEFAGTDIDLSNFDTSNVTDMKYMFYDCTNLTSLDLSSFDTSKVVYFGDMFFRCSSLTTLNLSNFSGASATSMFEMFAVCSNLTSLDLSGFDTSKVTNMNSMFDGCTSLNFLDIRNFDFSRVGSKYNGMFNNVPTNCEIIVKNDTVKNWLLSKFSNLTNVKTVAEYEAE